MDRIGQEGMKQKEGGGRCRIGRGRITLSNATNTLVLATGPNRPNWAVEAYSWARNQMFPSLEVSSGAASPLPRMQDVLWCNGCISGGGEGLIE